MSNVGICTIPGCLMCCEARRGPADLNPAEPLQPVQKAAWMPEFEALARYLDARDRKCDDGDCLEGYAQALQVLVDTLALPDRLDRVRDAFSQRLERQRRTGDVRGHAATASAIELIYNTP